MLTSKVQAAFRLSATSELHSSSKKGIYPTPLFRLMSTADVGAADLLPLAVLLVSFIMSK